MSENNSGRATMVSRRGVLAATGTASLALVAGCRDGGDGTSTKEPADDGDQTVTETDSEMSADIRTPSMPATVSSDIEELAIVGHQPDLDYFDGKAPGNADEYFPVRLTIENNGDQQTDAQDYYYDLTPYDDDDIDVSGATTGRTAPGGGTGTGLSPGGRGSVVAWSSVVGFSSQVVRYELTIKCGFGETVYCG
jgi:hypothetical protein